MYGIVENLGFLFFPIGQISQILSLKVVILGIKNGFLIFPKNFPKWSSGGMKIPKH